MRLRCTIRANMKHYQHEYKTIIPEVRLGYGRKGQALKDVILCIDQSGSMATSVVYSSVFGAVLASIRAVSTRMIVFDTSVVDLTDENRGRGGWFCRGPRQERLLHVRGVEI